MLRQESEQTYSFLENGSGSIAKTAATTREIDRWEDLYSNTGFGVGLVDVSLLTDARKDENVEARFHMMEKISVKNKSSEYRGAISSSYESSPLSDLFFSKENIDIIQHSIREGVHVKSNRQFIVAPQNISEIKIIMRTMYLQNAKDISDQKGVTENISLLNKTVSDYCIERVYNESIGYLKFLEDKSHLSMPMKLPVQSDRDWKQLAMPSRFF